MILYHGAVLEIQRPQIIKMNIGRDFGPAFYTTDIKEQAERWAKRRAMIETRKSKKRIAAIVNVYEWNMEKSLICKTFDGASLEWLDMVVLCRRLLL